jgi:hypothetical protein
VALCHTGRKDAIVNLKAAYGTAAYSFPYAKKYRSISEEIDDVTQRRSLSFIEFGIFTLLAADGSEFFILDIEEFRQRATGGSNFIHLITVMAAFWTFVIAVFHYIS